MQTIRHPLSIGALLLSIAGERDWFIDNGQDIERETGPLALGRIVSVDDYRSNGQGWSYGVVFPGGCWVQIDEADGIDDPEKYRVFDALPPVDPQSDTGLLRDLCSFLGLGHDDVNPVTDEDDDDALRARLREFIGAVSEVGAQTPDGPFYVVVDGEQTVGEFTTLDEARTEGRKLADAEPLPCMFSIQDEKGEHVEDIPRPEIGEQVQAFNKHRDARASLSEDPNQPCRLMLCDHETGREGQIRKGTRGELQPELERMKSNGRDCWIAPAA
jgi:hypothetical protein